MRKEEKERKGNESLKKWIKEHFDMDKKQRLGLTKREREREREREERKEERKIKMIRSMKIERVRQDGGGRWEVVVEL